MIGRWGQLGGFVIIRNCSHHILFIWSMAKLIMQTTKVLMFSSSCLEFVKFNSRNSRNNKQKTVYFFFLSFWIRIYLCISVLKSLLLI